MPPKSVDSVPKSMLARYEDITLATDAFCHARLDEQYLEICRLIAAALCRKRPPPVAQGNITHWVAGIIHAAGFINLLWDPDAKPFMRAADIAKHFGIGNGTTVARSKVIQRALGLFQLDPRYCRRSLIKDNPYAWFIEMPNGILVDSRKLSREVQQVLVDEGMIPFVWESPEPVDEPSTIVERPRAHERKAKAPQPENPNQGRLFG